MTNSNKVACLAAFTSHVAQGEQVKKADEDQWMKWSHLVTKLVCLYSVGTLYYALFCGPNSNKRLRWVPEVVTKVFGTWSVNVHIFPKEPTWHRHIDQVHPHYGVEQDADPGDPPILLQSSLIQRMEAMQKQGH